MCSFTEEPLRDPTGVNLVEPPPGLEELLLVRRERASRSRPKSVEVVDVEVNFVASPFPLSVAWRGTAPPPPSMTRATVAGLEKESRPAREKENEGV